MASSNIKLFDENKGNMLSDSEFNSSTQRMNGLQAGVASSKLQNKAMYQASLVAYAIAHVMMQNGKNANDTDAVSAFVANLSGAMLQKVYDLATTSEAQAGTATGKWMSPALVKAAFDYRKATTSEAQAGTNDTKWMSPALVKAEIDKILSDKNFLQKSGGTMTGNLVLNANPTANLGAATKQYVDAEVKKITPVFGDLKTLGYFKLGDMADAGNGKSLVYTNFLSFLNSKFDKLTEVLFYVKNSTWKNNGTSNNLSVQLTAVGSYTLKSVPASEQRTANGMFRLVPDYCYTSGGETHASLRALTANERVYVRTGTEDVKFESSGSNLSPVSIGTVEIWYK